MLLLDVEVELLEELVELTEEESDEDESSFPSRALLASASA